MDGLLTLRHDQALLRIFRDARIAQQPLAQAIDAESVLLGEGLEGGVVEDLRVSVAARIPTRTDFPKNSLDQAHTLAGRPHLRSASRFVDEGLDHCSTLA
jgi:hypothetical protein